MSQIYVLGVPSTMQVMFDIFQDQTRASTNDYCSNTATPPQMLLTDALLPGIMEDLLRPAPTGKFACMKHRKLGCESACCADCANVPTHNELVFLAEKQLPREGAQWIHIEGINSTQGGEPPSGGFDGCRVGEMEREGKEQDEGEIKPDNTGNNFCCIYTDGLSQGNTTGGAPNPDRTKCVSRRLKCSAQWHSAGAQISLALGAQNVGPLAEQSLGVHTRLD
ncbi:hypothetical protein B0H15DRAFT_797184 [Mycena belliarum]|uniref:Uncharacterized protein n=1 Tax=Mycena belliarum TaxID=1033014 RepID=A0AAD6UD73_9AGAR|nr:hypothetical protein B0H15DRAFT_797184 [Mycena belliae]